MQTPEPFQCPAAWDADSLVQSPEWFQLISSDESRELREVTEEIASTVFAPESIEGLATLGRLDSRMATIQQSLEKGTGATLLRGIDLSGLSDEHAKLMFWLVTKRLGTAVSQSATGERIFSVQDAGFDSSDKRARGPNTRKRLSFHTDRCDVIAFLCVRQAMEGGENDVISSVSLYNRIIRDRPDLCQVLMQPFYYMRHNVDQGNQKPYCRQPIFSIHEGHFAANILRVLIERAHQSPDLPDLTALQREALDYLEECAEDKSLYHRFRLEPGDMLFLNNWVTFHRRTEFVDADQEDQKRLLYRIWLSMPNSRPIDPLFVENYGATGAGEIRGGMKPSNAS